MPPPLFFFAPGRWRPVRETVAAIPPIAVKPMKFLFFLKRHTTENISVISDIYDKRATPVSAKSRLARLLLHINPDLNTGCFQDIPKKSPHL